MSTDLRLLAHEAAYQRLLLDSLGLAGRPMAIWAGPSSSSARVALRQLKAGGTVDRWMVKTPQPTGRRRLISEHRLRYAIGASRLIGPGTLATPEYVSAARDVAEWLAAQAVRRGPALLETPASTGVQVCLAASEHGHDIAGTWFRFAGEPYTKAKADVVARTGAHAICHYSVSEVGRVACACTTPSGVDDVHVLTEKLAVLQRPRLLEGGRTVQALHLTTLMAICPKIMLNVEVDDYAVLETRSCGCPLGELGLSTHVREIRSYEKLTGKGINFLGNDLIALVDEILPSRFGGAPTDYQLVEGQAEGLPRLGVVVSPRIGEIDEQALVEVVLATLERNPSNRSMVGAWREGATVRVLRREAYETGGAKLLPLHVDRRARSEL